MLARHTIIYFLARGIPGLINFSAIYIYTRMLLPEEYGIYALVLIVAKMSGIISFQWLRLGAFRFYTNYIENHMDQFLSTVLVSYAVLMSFVALLYGGVYVVWDQYAGAGFIWIIGLMFMFASNWFEMNLSILRAQLAPLAFGILSIARAVITLAVGVALVSYGLSANALIISLLVGNILPLLFIHKKQWGAVRLNKVNPALIRELLRYGLPLTATFAMAMVIYGMDRLMLGWMIGEREVGLYAVSYDFIQQTLLVIISVIVSASSPIIIREFERGMRASMHRQMNKTFELLLIIAVPSSIGIVMLAPNIGSVFFGEAYRVAAAALMPWIVPAVFLNGMKESYFDLPFTLSKRTRLQIWPVLLGASLNLVLNFLFIPAAGAEGAAIASLLSYGSAMAFSILLGRNVLHLPIPWARTGRVLGASLFMVLCLLPVWKWEGISALVVQVLVGMIGFVFAGWVLDLGFGRSAATRMWKTRREGKASAADRRAQ
ncbi:oligosaccharide flippase family protein [Halobacillus sp. BAB-2008]|uniref:lipopolysaccharide biosynthesis protein n=1 Tax=Halobacillus sp. BAB-2008 TaxID=1246484 RepID=UPI0002A4D6EA|nr:oligosaccharide flippase family protein [Halobacillus sp. BAB-2008]ELK46298.1 polysaccharide biosynthesis protein [Halobacillus sp. BAB-2008]